LHDISGYVTTVYYKNWWLGYILEKNEELDEVKVTFLHPWGPATSFSYPTHTDVLWVSRGCSHIVNLFTPTGRTYSLVEGEVSQTQLAYFTFCHLLLKLTKCNL
jgi:hypothetical protein